MPNQKLAGSAIIDCRVQTGKCPRDCNQCYYNLFGKHEEVVLPERSTDKIVRMNAEHDSYYDKELCECQALGYKDSFFNTSFGDLDYPRPVVLTANSRETTPWKGWIRPHDFTESLANLMFVRLRLSVENRFNVYEAAAEWARQGVPVVLTYMRYYKDPPSWNNYEKRKHIENECWQLTENSRSLILISAVHRVHNESLLYDCHGLCKDCRQCEIFYLLAKKRMQRVGTFGEQR